MKLGDLVWAVISKNSLTYIRCVHETIIRIQTEEYFHDGEKVCEVKYWVNSVNGLNKSTDTVFEDELDARREWENCRQKLLKNRPDFASKIGS